jgi:hypothetical protein
VTSSAVLIGDTITRYIDECAVNEEWLTGRDPLIRPVDVRTATWRPWLRDGGSHRPKSYCPPCDEGRHAVALDVLDNLAPEVPGTADARITRRDLLQYSGRLEDGDDALVRLWVATMIWGAGTSNGRGPWRTAQGLADGPLVGVLRDTADLVRTDRISDAFRAFRVRGCGVAFFTKWFWTVSLAAPVGARALILDKRVVDCLNRMHRVSGIRGRAWWRDYPGYLDEVDAAVTRISSRYPGIDAEKVEYLLFERATGSDVGRLSLSAWLDAGHGT